MSLHREELIGQLDQALDGIPQAEEWPDAQVVVVGDGHVVQDVSAFTDEDGFPVVLVELAKAA